MNDNEKREKICCIGIGNRGLTAVDIMIENGLKNVEFWEMDTEKALSDKIIAKNIIKIGGQTQAFSDSDESARAAEEAKADIANAVDKAGVVFVVVGLGGETGMGAAPVVAKIAKEAGALTIGIVSEPYGFEGEQIIEKASQGIGKLKEAFDTLIVIPNDEAFDISEDFFAASDEAVSKSIQCITDIIKIPGLVNIELKDIESVLKSSGYSIVGMGKASGNERGYNAAKKAIEFISLQNDISKASGVIMNITGSNDMTLVEAAAAANILSDKLSKFAIFHFGVVVDDKMDDEIQVTIIATGFSEAGV